MLDLARIDSALISRYHTWVYWSESDCPPTLFAALRAQLPHLAAEAWPRLIRFSGAFVNGAKLFDDAALKAPCRIEYYEPKYDVEKAAELFPPFTARQIVYEDEELAVVFKPYGLPTLPGRDQASFSLKLQLEELFGASIHLPSRLDMSACGLVAVSKSNKLHRLLQRLFERRLLDKYYLLEGSGRAEFEELRVDAAIAKDPRHPVLRTTVATGGKPALTLFTKVAEARLGTDQGEQLETSLLRAQLITGRTHQIRVHANSIGLPIVGDNFYGGAGAPQLRLMSCQLVLRHPLSRQQLDIRVPERLLPDWCAKLAPGTIFTSTEPRC